MNQDPPRFARSTVLARRATRWMSTLAIVSTLAACASSVPLTEVPVVERSGSAVSPLPQGSVTPGAQSGAADQRNVSPVQVAPTQAAQPEAMARVIYFDYDSFVVRPEFAATLEAHAKYLAADRTRKLALEGHTDERGGREYNLALGQKRAEAVRRALGLLGVSDAQVEPVSFGEEKPAVNGFNEEAYAKNRRVEFSYR